MEDKKHIKPALLALISLPTFGMMVIVTAIPIILLLILLTAMSSLLSFGEGSILYDATKMPTGSGAVQSSLTDSEIEDILAKVFPPEDEMTEEEATAKVALTFALTKVGYPYDQSRRASGEAFDCSSLAWYSYHEAGIDIPGGSASWPPTAAVIASSLSKDHPMIKPEDMRPGDLIFWRTSSAIKEHRFMGIGHVAIYVGNGMIVEAQGKKTGVVYGPLGTRTNVAAILRAKCDTCAQRVIVLQLERSPLCPTTSNLP